MAKLWESAKPSKSGTLLDLISYIFSSKFEHKVKDNIVSVMQNEDSELLKICETLRMDATSDTLQKIYRASLLTATGINFKFTIKNVRYRIEECKELVNLFIKFGQW